MIHDENIFPSFSSIGSGESVMNMVDEDTYRSRLRSELTGKIQAHNLQAYIDESVRKIKMEKDMLANRLLG